MGSPAATSTSYHVCPQKTAKKPHVGGAVVSAGTVTVGGLLVFSVGDTSVRQLANSHDPFFSHQVNSAVVMLELGVIHLAINLCYY